MKMSPVVHFEMPADDNERVSKFYESVFGWQMEVMGKEYNGYLMAMTTESDQKGPKKAGAINGGFYKKPAGQNPPPHLVISVDNIDESIKAVMGAGGEIIGEKMDIPGVGIFISFKDTENNIVGMLQSTTTPMQSA